MTLHIRQIVLVARDLEAVVSQLCRVFDLSVCYRDPGVGEFGLENALMRIGNSTDAQFLEVVAPFCDNPASGRDNTAAGRHLEKYGDSGYMLLLQTDDFTADRQRLDSLGVRVIWEAAHPDIRAMHLHPKDIGGAIVSIDQPNQPTAWRWAGPGWQQNIGESESGMLRVLSTSLTAKNPAELARRWAEVLGTGKPLGTSGHYSVAIAGGVLEFIAGQADCIAGFDILVADVQRVLDLAQQEGLVISGNSLTVCGAQFNLFASEK